MISTTDFSKKQLATILSALDDAPRSPANKGEALRAIGRSAKRFGLTTDDVLAAAAGLLDGRLSAADFRVELHDLAGPDQTADSGQRDATTAQDHEDAGDTPAEPTEPPHAAQEPATPEPATPAKRRAKAKAKPAKVAPTEQAHATGRHQAGANDRPAQAPRGRHRRADRCGHRVAAPHHPRRHLWRLKKKLGLNVEATRTREVGPNKTGAKGSSTVYRIVG